MQKALTATCLVYKYNDLVAVDGACLEVYRGEVFGLLGPNGAGKSTIIEILVGLKGLQEGEASVLDFDLRESLKELKRKIGVQLQTPSLFTRLRVFELLQLFASFYPSPLSVGSVLEKTGLTEKKNTLSGKLSGGQLQRLNVALALISNGELIFLDEPTTGLDPQSRRNIWEAVEEIKKQNRTVFFTTHYMEEAQRLCDRVAIIDQGKVIALGKPEELIEEHFSDQAIEFELSAQDVAFLKEQLPGGVRLELNGEKATVYTEQILKTIDFLINLQNQGLNLHSFSVRKATLEDVFIKLTGRRIRA